MKKLIALFLIPVFLMATQGIAVNFLYCKGDVTQQGIQTSSCCKGVNKDGCCHFKTEVIKVKQTFVTSDHTWKKVLSPDLIQPLDFIVHCVPFIDFNTGYYFPRSHAPPLDKRELYILFRSLLI